MCNQQPKPRRCRHAICLLPWIVSVWYASVCFGAETIPDLVAIRIEADALKAEQMKVATELLQTYPDSFNAVRVMGYVHSTHGNTEKMLECWQRCRDLSPERPDIYDQLGRYYLRIEQYDDALAMWEQTLRLDPDFPQVYLRMGIAYLESGNSEKAIEVLKRQIEKTPNDSDCHYQLGEAYFQIQDFQSAKSEYEKAVALAPNHSKAVYGLVKSSARLGQAADAKRYSARFQQLERAAAKADAEYRKNFDDLQQVRADVAVTFIDAGRIYAADKKLERAITLWERAAQIDKTNQMARNLAAKAYLITGKRREALRHLTELARLDPKNARYVEQIGKILASMGKLKGAERAFRKVIQLEPNDPYGYRLLAKYYLNTNQKFEQAYELARTAAIRAPVADSYFVLGWAAMKLDKSREAEAALNRAVKLDPQNKLYQNLQAKLRERSNPSKPATTDRP